MNDGINLNLPVLTVDGFVEQLTQAYSAIIKSGASLKIMPSVMLWGPPGVGKSQGVRQIAERLRKETGKRTVVTDVRLLLFNPVDLRGIPTANADKTLAIWLKPQIFQMDPSEDVVNILFLDEISAAPQSVQAAAYQITLDRVVGEHKLPENCIVIAAGNRVTDRSVSYKMPKALANRLLHIEVTDSVSSWLRWAAEVGINEKVIGFLSFRSDRLFGFQPDNSDLAFPSPRTWEMVSTILNTVSDDVDSVYSLIAGLLGCGTAMEFKAWSRVYREIPSMQEIFSGRSAAVPQNTDAMYAVVSSMITFAREHKDDEVMIGNSICYARRLPADFGAMLLQSYEQFSPDYRSFLRRVPEYRDFASRMGVMRNGEA